MSPKLSTAVLVCVSTLPVDGSVYALVFPIAEAQLSVAPSVNILEKLGIPKVVVPFPPPYDVPIAAINAA